jgi:hypothetical protein
MDGIAATAELRIIAPSSVVVMLSLYDDPSTRQRPSSRSRGVRLRGRGSGTIAVNRASSFSGAYHDDEFATVILQGHRRVLWVRIAVTAWQMRSYQ